MSRRRVSVRDLGAVDCQGWLHRRKEGRSFLGSKWKRYWFVLQKSSVYWYRDKMDDKAEGFINLSGFTIEQAKHCRRKHAITAAHPHVVTIFIAAETFTEMNKWISKLSEAAELQKAVGAEDCYSEASDLDADDCASTCSEDFEHESGDAVQPLGESPSCGSSPSSAAERRRRSSSEGRRGSGGSERLSWPHLSEGAAPRVQAEDVRHETRLDEMESLYNHLRAGGLSVTGQCSRRDFRASFVRRCRNDWVNEKLHLLRILRSTLKAKELELQTVEQLLMDTTLSPTTYREWRLSHHILFQEICKCHRAAGGATAPMPEARGEDTTVTAP